MGEVVAETVARWRAVRDASIAALDGLSEEDLQRKTTWRGIERNVNFLVRQYGMHDLDHIGHVSKLLARQGRQQTEARVLLAKMQALHGELEGLVLGLTDEELTRDPGDGEWSIAHIIDHLAESESRFTKRIVEIVAAG